MPRTKKTSNQPAAENKPKRKRNDIKGTGQDWRKGVTKYTPDEIKAKSDEYFLSCTEADRKPTLEGLARCMDVSAATLKRWLKADDAESENVYNPDVCEALKKAMDYIMDDIQQHTDGMSVFRAKQDHYGGYTDRQMNDGNGQITFNVVVGNNDDKSAAKYGK